MIPITLPNGTVTSRIGFGCAGLIGGRRLRESQALIDAAIEVGIRHFDVAPIYGQGLAENALGACLANIGVPVTITTKVGLARPAPQYGISRWLHTAARSTLKFAPALRQNLGSKAYAMARRTAFGVEDVQASLTESLQRLRRDRIDILLLHEPDVEDITPALIGWLERQRAAGIAGIIGFGSRREKVAAILERWPGAEFIQTNWVPGEATPAVGGRLLSLHGAARALARTRERMMRDADFDAQIAEAVADGTPSDDTLVRMLSASALAEQPDAMLLMASKEPKRVRAFGEPAPRIMW
jgi:hypothetical protein